MELETWDYWKVCENEQIEMDSNAGGDAFEEFVGWEKKRNAIMMPC